MTAYSEDFFETIVGVSWASLALIFEGGGSGNGDPGAAPARMSIEFRGVAGGTPGFTLNEGFAPSGNLRSAPFSITDRIMSTGVTTGAGLNFSGYGAYTTKTLSSFPAPSLVAGVVLRLGGEFASKFQAKITLGPFAGLPIQPVRLALASGVSPGKTAGGQTFSPGFSVPSIAPAGINLLADFAFQASYGTTVTFLVDPQNKSVSVV